MWPSGSIRKRWLARVGVRSTTSEPSSTLFLRLHDPVAQTVRWTLLTSDGKSTPAYLQNNRTAKVGRPRSIPKTYRDCLRIGRDLAISSPTLVKYGCDDSTGCSDGFHFAENLYSTKAVC